MSSILNAFAGGNSNLMNLKNDSESTVVEIDEQELIPFHNHPFEIYDGEEKEKLVATIKANGITNPLIVRKSNNGKYEVISGHNRLDAARRIGLEKVPCIVKMMADDYEVTQLMFASNTYRKKIKHSEKARGYKLQYDALVNRATDGNALERVAQDNGEKEKTVQRYIRLGYLNSILLYDMDHGSLPLGAAYEIAFLDEKQQEMVADALEETRVKMTITTAKAIRAYMVGDALSYEELCRMLTESDSKDQPQKAAIAIDGKRIATFFPDGTSPKEMESVILELLCNRMNEEQGKEDAVQEDVPGQMIIQNTEMEVE